MNKENIIWQGRDDSAEAAHGTQRLHQIVRYLPTSAVKTSEVSETLEGDAAVLGFASDAGVARNCGRTGARRAPQEIRRALANLPAHSLTRFWDAGDVICAGDDLEQAQAELGERVAHLLDRSARPVVIGGGHEVAWGSFQGLRDHLLRSGKARGRILVLNLDAHFDLRATRPGNSGTPFDQILEDASARDLSVRYACFGVSRLSNTEALYERARSLGVRWREDTRMQERYFDACIAAIDELLSEADHVYLSIDTDVLPASVAPGVSAPAAYGVPLSVVEACALRVKESGKLLLADIAEFNPDYDIDAHTARVVARLVWGLMQPT